LVDELEPDRARRLAGRLIGTVRRECACCACRIESLFNFDERLSGDQGGSLGMPVPTDLAPAKGARGHVRGVAASGHQQEIGVAGVQQKLGHAAHCMFIQRISRMLANHQ